MQYPSLLPAVKKLLVETVDMPVPTNRFVGAGDAMTRPYKSIFRK